MLLVNMHHIVSDGWSIGVLVRELSLLYRAFCAGQADPSATTVGAVRRLSRSGSGAGYAGTRWKAQLRYWREQLAGAPTCWSCRPTIRGRPSRRVGGASVEVHSATDLERASEATLPRAGGDACSCCCWRPGRCCCRATRVKRTWSSVRRSPTGCSAETEELIGFFVNTLALRSDLSGDPRFSDLLRQVRERTLAAYAHQDLPFEQLVDAFEPERDLSRESLVQVMFAWQNAPVAELELGELSCGVVAAGADDLQVRSDPLTG